MCLFFVSFKVFLLARSFQKEEKQQQEEEEENETSHKEKRQVISPSIRECIFVWTTYPLRQQSLMQYVHRQTDIHSYKWRIEID